MNTQHNSVEHALGLTQNKSETHDINDRIDFTATEKRLQE